MVNTNGGIALPEYVSIKQLADELGLDRSNMRKYVIKHGFNLVNIRTADSRGQLTLALTADDAEAVRALRESQGFCFKSCIPQCNDDGYFYVVQVIPEFDPNRVKLGFTNDIMGRLDAHRTAAPTAQLSKHWNCHRTWEVAAAASITREDCHLIANEVYECGSLDTLLIRADDFFAIMP